MSAHVQLDELIWPIKISLAFASLVFMHVNRRRPCTVLLMVQTKIGFNGNLVIPLSNRILDQTKNTFNKSVFATKRCLKDILDTHLGGFISLKGTRAYFDRRANLILLGSQY